MNAQQHRKLWKHYLSRHYQLAKTVKDAPRYVVENYHAVWHKAQAHKKAMELLNAEARNPRLIREMSAYFASIGD